MREHLHGRNITHRVGSVLYSHEETRAWPQPGADPGFQVMGGHLKKMRRGEGGAKICVVFRVKNYDFMPGAPPPLDPPLAT
jgi:hypothetical protein